MQRTVCLDTNILMWGLLQQGKAADEIKREKSRYLIEELSKDNNIRVVIPALILSELAVKMTESDRISFFSYMRLYFEVIDFNSSAALEYPTIRTVGMELKSKELSRKEVTVDSLIVATCRAHGVNTLYSDDQKMRQIAAPFMQVEGLPVPPPIALSLLDIEAVSAD